MRQIYRRALLAALVALMIGAGVAAEPAQQAGAERATVEQVAGSKGAETFGRESS